MTYEIVITGDYNDADYDVETNSITEEELVRFKPVFDAIVAKTAEVEKGRGTHNFWTFGPRRGQQRYTEMYAELDQELLEEFCERFVPRGGDSEYGIHTIDSIVYYPVPEKTVIL
jgi:hypothetical protein